MAQIFPIFCVILMLKKKEAKQNETFICTSFFQDSLKVIPSALVDVTVKNAPVLSKYQFERVGFFCIDCDSTSNKVSEAAWMVKFYHHH